MGKGRCIAIVGKTNSGKTSLANALADGEGFRRIVSYTTRKPREGEVDRKDYIFVTKEHFKQMFVTDMLHEITVRNGEFYGTAHWDYSLEDNSVIILDTKGIKNLPIKATIVYLDLSDGILRRHAHRRGDDLVLFEERLARDNEEFDEFEEEVRIDLHVRRYSSIPHLVKRLKQEFHF